MSSGGSKPKLPPAPPPAAPAVAQETTKQVDMDQSKRDLFRKGYRSTLLAGKQTGAQAGTQTTEKRLLGL
jgi:hypothetical protein